MRAETGGFTTDTDPSVKLDAAAAAISGVGGSLALHHHLPVSEICF